MEILKQTPKITLATLKSFAKRNKERLFVKHLREFDGMTDGVEECRNKNWFPSSLITSNYYRSGIDGIYTVGSSRDYFNLYEDSEYIGIKVYNCCGSSILAIKK